MCNDPNQMFPNMMMQNPNMMMPYNMNSPNMYSQQTNQNDFNTRLNAMERQIRRMNERLTRLEANGGASNYNEPDNSMYMM